MALDDNTDNIHQGWAMGSLLFGFYEKIDHFRTAAHPISYINPIVNKAGIAWKILASLHYINGWIVTYRQLELDNELTTLTD